MAYAGSKSQSGRGSSLAIGPIAGTVTPTYVNVGEVRTSGISGAQWGTVDVTNFDSGPDEEFISTIRNNGEVNIAGNRVSTDTGQIACETAFATGGIYMWKIAVPKATGQVTTGDTYTFNGLLMSRDFTLDVTKENAWNVKIKISGAVTFTAGA